MCILKLSEKSIAVQLGHQWLHDTDHRNGFSITLNRETHSIIIKNKNQFCSRDGIYCLHAVELEYLELEYLEHKNTSNNMDKTESIQRSTVVVTYYLFLLPQSIYQMLLERHKARVIISDLVHILSLAIFTEMQIPANLGCQCLTKH